jgi:hypothetical protein
MTPFDEDWHLLSLARGVLELLCDPVAGRRRDVVGRRLEHLAVQAAERVDHAVHRRTPGRYRLALRRTELLSAFLERLDLDGAGAGPLTAAVLSRARQALVLQRALLEDLAAGRRVAPGRH